MSGNKLCTHIDRPLRDRKSRTLEEVDNDSAFVVLYEMCNDTMHSIKQEFKKDDCVLQDELNHLQMLLNDTWSIVVAYDSDGIHGHPFQVYSFMRCRNIVMSRQLYAALMRVLSHLRVRQNYKVCTLLAALAYHMMGLFTRQEYSRITKATEGIDVSSAQASSLKRRPMEEDTDDGLK